MAIRTLTKLLAGAQDLLFGRGTITQVRNGTSYDIERVALIKPVDLLADIKALPTTNPDKQFFELVSKGSLAINDGGGGTYYFDATSTATPDDVSVILPDDIDIANPGRWLKQLAEGVDKAGDTMTGQLKGIPPVSANDLTRKDYVDAQFLNHLDGFQATGLLSEYTGDLDLIAKNSTYRASTSIATNYPTELPSPRLFVVQTIMSYTGTDHRIQIVTAASTNLDFAGMTWARTTLTGDAGWSTWRRQQNMYGANGNIIATGTDVASVANHLNFSSAATGENPKVEAVGEDVGVTIAGTKIHDGTIEPEAVGPIILSPGADLVKADGRSPGFSTTKQGVLVMLEEPSLLVNNSGTNLAWVTVDMSTSTLLAQQSVIDGAKGLLLKVKAYRKYNAASTSIISIGVYIRPTGSGNSLANSEIIKASEYSAGAFYELAVNAVAPNVVVQAGTNGDFDWYCDGYGGAINQISIWLVGYYV